jgi:hydrogenase small subunit
MHRIPDELLRDSEEGVERRDFMKVCALAAAAVGASSATASRWAEAASGGLKPSVIWLHFQECTGCTESLLRTSHPDVARLILDLISLDYHETLFAAAGHQIEHALQQAMDQHDGKFVCVVEGAIPTKHDGVYCRIGGKSAVEMLEEVSSRAAAVVAIGSCAAFGGIPSADPNPTGAVGAPSLVEDKPLVTIPGCPANPYNFLGTVMHYLTEGGVPDLDGDLRPVFAYGRTIHDDCPRRYHFDQGKFAEQFDDEGHRKGWCLYELGCKGPHTKANCAITQYNEVGAWPVGVGCPCEGCTEKEIAFRVPRFEVMPAEGAPDQKQAGGLGAGPAAIVGAVGGIAAGAGAMAVRKRGGFEQEPADETKNEQES